MCIFHIFAWILLGAQWPLELLSSSFLSALRGTSAEPAVGKEGHPSVSLQRAHGRAQKRPEPVLRAELGQAGWAREAPSPQMRADMGLAGRRGPDAMSRTPPTAHMSDQCSPQECHPNALSQEGFEEESILRVLFLGAGAFLLFFSLLLTRSVSKEENSTLRPHIWKVKCSCPP